MSLVRVASVYVELIQPPDDRNAQEIRTAS